MSGSKASELTNQLPRILMLGTFALHPKGTMSARAAGLARTLAQRGWNVQIATVPWDNPTEAGKRYSLQGVPIVNTRSISPNLAPLAVRELISISNQFQPALIHLFKPKGFGDFAARLLRRRGIPVVVDMDDWEGDGGWNDRLSYSGLQRRVFQWQETSWPGMADAVTVASRTLEQYAIDLQASPSNISYLPNMLTEERVQQLVDLGHAPVSELAMLREPHHARVLLYTRFVETTPAFIVDFLRVLVAREPDAQLVIAGRSADGAVEREIKSVACSSGIDNRIIWLDWIDPADLGWIARQCSLALVPFEDSLVNRSKCSIKLLELLAAGIPVVASSVGENREYLHRHGGGVLARPGDVENHVDRTIELLSSRAEHTVVRPRDEMTWQHVIPQVVELYHSVVQQRTSPSSAR